MRPSWRAERAMRQVFAAQHDWAEDPLRFFAVQGAAFFVLLLAGLFVLRGKWRSVAGRHGVVAAGFSAALALGAAQIATAPSCTAASIQLSSASSVSIRA